MPLPLSGLSIWAVAPQGRSASTSSSRLHAHALLSRQAVRQILALHGLRHCRLHVCAAGAAVVAAPPPPVGCWQAGGAAVVGFDSTVLQRFSHTLGAARAAGSGAKDFRACRNRGATGFRRCCEVQTSSMHR